LLNELSPALLNRVKREGSADQVDVGVEVGTIMLMSASGARSDRDGRAGCNSGGLPIVCDSHQPGAPQGTGIRAQSGPKKLYPKLG
jgi:hypothetical protein